MRRRLERILLVMAALAAAGAAWGQGPTGTLNGTVLDQFGAVIPGAAVVATNSDTNVDYKATSTEAGAYTISYMPAGTYKVRVRAAGFRVAEANNVIVRVAQTLSMNITLQVGAVTEQVTVSDQPPVLEAGTAEIGRYVSVEEYKSWPIMVGSSGQRMMQSFIFSSLAGTTGDQWEGSINGGQEFSHQILVEGIPVGRADLAGASSNAFQPSVEAIGEFKLQAGTVSADYNGGQTAVANFSIKSGTNDLHGSVFDYIQNEALNAEDLATKTQGLRKPRFRQNNWGFAVGGPAEIPHLYHGRNKTFWFVDLERNHYDSLRTSGFTTLPTINFKDGDFSQLLNPAYTGNSQSGKQIGTDALGRPVIFGQLYDPSTTRKAPNGAIVRDPFPNNTIAQNRWDPVAKAVIGSAGIADPQYGTMVRNESKVNGSPIFDIHSFGTKIDHNISDSERLSGYFNSSLRDQWQNGAAAYLPIPGSPTSSWMRHRTPGYLARLSLSSTLTPSILNRVAAGFNRYVNINGAPPSTLDQDWAGKLGLQNTAATMFPVFKFSGKEYQGGTITQLGVGSASNTPNGSYVLQDDFTWIHGKHNTRAGYTYTRYYFNARSLSDAGTFNFSPRQTDLPGYLNQTGNAFASFLLGAASSASHNVQTLTQGFRQPQHALYVMDDWKITPKLTLNAGLRWEIIPPFYEVTGRMSEVDLTVPNPEAGNRPGALVFAGPGRSRFAGTYWKEIGPRIGLAYQVNPKLVVRTGYAILNTPPICNNWSYGAFTYGFNGSVRVAAGTSPTGYIDDPSIYLRQPFPSMKATLPNMDPAAENFQTATTTARDANRPGYTQNWNFTVQYQLPKETALEVAYVGNKGTRMWAAAFNDYDVLPSRLLSMGDTLNEAVGDHPQYLPYAGFDPSLTVAQAMLPYPQYFGVQEQFPYNTNSNYNALQVTVTKHLSSELGFVGAYTWSKAIGFMDQMGPGAYYATVQDYANRGLERSVTSFNLPQTFKLTWVYSPPIGKGKRLDLKWGNYALGGWQLSAIHNYMSGPALQLYESGVTVPAGIGFGIRPDLAPGNQTLSGAPGAADFFNGTPYLNPDAFVQSPMTGNGTPLRVGTAPRFLPNVRGPHSMSETFRMAKKFPLIRGSERSFLQVGMTMTNPFNRISRYIADTTVGDSAFGQVFAGGGGRTLQLDARISF